MKEGKIITQILSQDSTPITLTQGDLSALSQPENI